MSRIEITFLCLCSISLIAILIFVLRSKQDDYKIIIEKLEKDKLKNIELLKEGNKKIDIIEAEILKCKKKLNIKLFKSKR